MAVEIEEIAYFGLFRYKNKLVMIQEEHFKDIATIAPVLTPISIDHQWLNRLGFLRYPNGALYRQENGNDFFLKPLKDGRWEFLLNGDKRIRILTYVHQVQRLWFSLMDDHLVLPKNAQATSVQQTKHKSGTFQKRH